jgi:hypothetical protein
MSWRSVPDPDTKKVRILERNTGSAVFIFLQELDFPESMFFAKFQELQR